MKILHLHHHHHRVSSIKRHQMSKGCDTSTEDKIIRQITSDTNTPRVYMKSLRRPVKKPSTAPTLFATHNRFEQREHFLKNFSEGHDRSANTRPPLAGQDSILHLCLRKASAVLHLASTYNSCIMETILVIAPVYSVFVF